MHCYERVRLVQVPEVQPFEELVEAQITWLVINAALDWLQVALRELQPFWRQAATLLDVFQGLYCACCTCCQKADSWAVLSHKVVIGASQPATMNTVALSLCLVYDV